MQSLGESSLYRKRLVVRGTWTGLARQYGVTDSSVQRIAKEIGL